MNKKAVPEMRVQHFEQTALNEEANDKNLLQFDAVIHELRVLQVELETQNTDLLVSNAALKKSNDRYFKMYEFAPVGYISLNSDGIITEMNLTSAAMLERERGNCLRHLFSHFVMLEDMVSWQTYFSQIKTFKHDESIELSLCTASNRDLCVQLNSVYTDVEDLIPLFHFTITDITKIKLANQQALLMTEKMVAISHLNANPVEVNLNQNIRAIRQMKGWSQEEMAEKLDMSLNGYGCIERGETDMSLSRIKQIAVVFNLSVCELLDFHEWSTNTRLIKQATSCQCHYEYQHSELVRHYATLDEQHKKAMTTLLELERLKVIAEQKENENVNLRKMLAIALTSKNQ